MRKNLLEVGRVGPGLARRFYTRLEQALEAKLIPVHLCIKLHGIFEYH